MGIVLGVAQLVAWGLAFWAAVRMERPMVGLCAFFGAQYVQALFAVWDDVSRLTWWEHQWVPREAVVVLCAAWAAAQIILRATPRVKGRIWVLIMALSAAAAGWLWSFRLHPALYDRFLSLRLALWVSITLALVCMLGYLWECGAMAGRKIVQSASVLALFGVVICVWSTVSVWDGTAWFVMRAGYRLLVLVCCAGWVRALRPTVGESLVVIPLDPSIARREALIASGEGAGTPELTTASHSQFRVRFGPSDQFRVGRTMHERTTPPLPGQR